MSISTFCATFMAVSINNRLVDHQEVGHYFLITSMNSGLLKQFQTFGKLYLIQLLGLLIGMGLLRLLHLIHPRLLTGYGMLDFFKNWILWKFRQGICCYIFFSVIDSFRKSLQEYPVNAVSLEILKAPFLVLHFFLLYINDFLDDAYCYLCWWYYSL